MKILFTILLFSSILFAGNTPPPLLVKKGGLGVNTNASGYFLQGNTQSPVTSTFRIISGTVDSSGGIVYGSGFTITKGATGRYQINFTVAFNASPIVICNSMAIYQQCHIPSSGTYSATTLAPIENAGQSNSDNDIDGAFSFVAVGN